MAVLADFEGHFFRFSFLPLELCGIRRRYNHAPQRTRRKRFRLFHKVPVSRHLSHSVYLRVSAQGVIRLYRHHRPVADIATLVTQAINVSPLKTISVEAWMIHRHFAYLGQRANKRVERTARLRLSYIHRFWAGSRSPAALSGYRLGSVVPQRTPDWLYVALPDFPSMFEQSPAYLTLLRRDLRVIG